MNLDLTATLLICFLGIAQHITLPRSGRGKGRNIDACSAMREDSCPKLLPLLLVLFGLPGLTGLGQTIISQLAHQIGAFDSVDHRSLISTSTHYWSQHLLCSHLCMSEKKEERTSPDTQCFKSKEHISGKKWHAVLPHCWLAAVEEEQESTGNAGKQKYSCFSFFIVLVVFFFPSSDNIWLEIEGHPQCAPGHSWLQVWEMYTGWMPQNDTCIYLLTCKLFEPDSLISDRQVTDCIFINTSISEPHTIQLLKYSSLPSSPWTQGIPLETMLTHRAQEGKSGDETGSCSTSLYFQPWKGFMQLLCGLCQRHGDWESPTRFAIKEQYIKLFTWAVWMRANRDSQSQTNPSHLSPLLSQSNTAYLLLCLVCA